MLTWFYYHSKKIVLNSHLSRTANHVLIIEKRHLSFAKNVLSSDCSGTVPQLFIIWKFQLSFETNCCGNVDARQF